MRKNINKNIAFNPGGKLKLELPLPSGDFLRFNCLVMWTDLNDPKEYDSLMGLKVDEHKSEYKTFFKTLSLSHAPLI